MIEHEQLLASLPKEMQRLVVFSRLEGDFTYLQMEVITYVDLWERAEVVVDFIERVWRTFEPFQVKLEATVMPRYDTRKNALRTFGLKPTWKKWMETRQLLLGGKIAGISMHEWEATHSHCLRPDTDVYLDVHFGDWWGQTQGHRTTERPLYDPRQAKMFKLCINTRVWDGTVSTEVQDQTVSLACDLFLAVDGACGYVHIGDEYANRSHITPHERQLGMEKYGPNLSRLCGEVRGAFWGNLLSARHVQVLGGSQLVRQQAPCHKVISLADSGERVNDWEPLYLQVTPTLEETTVDDCAQLESFLSPVLVSTLGQRGITILDRALVTNLGDATHLKASIEGSMRRAAVLPLGALLIEYDQPDGWPAAYDAVRRIGGYETQGYRSIPQLRKMWSVDDAIVWTLTNLIPPRPRSGPLFPTVVIQPCIPGDELEFQLSFVDPPTSNIKLRLRELVEEWSALKYDMEPVMATVSLCTVPEWSEDTTAWQTDLAPVGQDAYLQLVMMLDEFSKTTARLAEVYVGAWSH